MNARCSTHAGSDRCELAAGHVGEHHTMWGVVSMRWRGDEEWSHPREDRFSDVLSGPGSTGTGEHISERHTGAERHIDETLNGEATNG